MVSRDFLDEMMAERTKTNPEFPRLLDAAVARHQLQGDPASRPEPPVGRPNPK